MFIPVVPYRHLLPNLCLFVPAIANPDLFACGSWTWISIDIASHPVSPHGRLARQTVIVPPLLGPGGVDINCTCFARPL